MQNTTLEEKINAIGSDTIMCDANNYVEKPIETKEDGVIEEPMTQEEAKQEATGTAINKISQKALHKMMFGPIPPMKKDSKIGRNDPCACGSGKKYKNCCLASGKYETYSR